MFSHTNSIISYLKSLRPPLPFNGAVFGARTPQLCRGFNQVTNNGAFFERVNHRGDSPCQKNGDGKNLTLISLIYINIM